MSCYGTAPRALALAVLLASHALAQAPPSGSFCAPGVGGIPPGVRPPGGGSIIGGTGGINLGGGPGFTGTPPGPPGTFSGDFGGKGTFSGTPPMPGTFSGATPMAGFPSTGGLALPPINPKAPLKELLPQAPKLRPIYVGEDLKQVPELQFEAFPEKPLNASEWHKRKLRHVAVALHLNGKEQDGYLKAMLKMRPDLKGVAFNMGDGCRQKGLQVTAFKQQAAQVKRLSPENVASSFVNARTAAMSASGRDKEKAEQLIQAHIAAVRQIGPAHAERGQLPLVRYLTSAPRVEATRELARIAVFSLSAPAREEALEALAVRREADYAPILVEALRYPWPQVARNATAAIVKLGRKDLMPELVALLDEADPRGPRVEKVGDKKAIVARELVRINHHHNCMLCHAPAEHAKATKDLLVAEMPVPNQRMSPSMSAYSRAPRSNLIVRVDVTYLRQDFSLMQAVKPDGHWPASQRFDFVVRKRELTGEQADELWKRVTPRRKGDLTPYQKAAVAALRQMSGKNLEARASVWREQLKH